MAAWASEMPERRVDAFRLGRWVPLMLGLLLAAIGVASLAILTLDAGGARGSDDDLWFALAAYAVLAFALVAFWLAWRRPVMLRVGPEGLHVPLGYARPFRWDEIRGLAHRQRRAGVIQKVNVLEIDLVPGTEIPVRWRIPVLAAIDRWGAKNLGIRAPLQQLSASEDTIIASIERFHPVTRKK